jgi:predicted ATPase
MTSDPLVDLIDPRRLPERVLNALRVPLSPVMEPPDQLVAVLGSTHTTGTRRPLLLLDNFEHLLPAGAEIVQTLLERLPSLTCLVTSRRPLLLEGEKELVVRPLPTPAEPAPVRELARCAGVRLFVDRARAVRPDFQLT